MRYRCLILDHDDTAVNSTRTVHYPAHIEAMKILRPGRQVVDAETWFAKNFDPGIMEFLVDELGLSDQELKVEEGIWREYTSRLTPDFYPGFLEVLNAYQQQGGYIVVASHSDEEVIQSHYRAAANGYAVDPDLIFGWRLGVEKRKPHPYPVIETLRRFELDRSEVLVLDDLKPGVDMAKAAGVDVAAAAWSHNIPMVRAYMQANCVATFATVEEFAEFVL